MRTIPLGDYHRPHYGQKLYRQDHHKVEAMAEPEGDDIPVFDRYASGGRGEYERPWREEEDRVEVRTLKPWRRW